MTERKVDKQDISCETQNEIIPWVKPKDMKVIWTFFSGNKLVKRIHV